MIDTVSAILSANSFCYYVVGALTVLAALIINALTDSRAIAATLVPPMWFGGLTGIFAMRNLGIAVSPDKDSNVVISATIGMATGLMLALVLVRIYFLIVGSSTSKPFTKADHTALR